MIIKLVMDVIYAVFNFLTSPIDIPDLPLTLTDILGSAYEYIATGIGILANYTHYDYLFGCFMVIVAVEFGLHIYQFVMYILRKVPFLGLK